jgi:hypothetical protein
VDKQKGEENKGMRYKRKKRGGNNNETERQLVVSLAKDKKRLDIWNKQG